MRPTPRVLIPAVLIGICLLPAPSAAAESAPPEDPVSLRLSDRDGVPRSLEDHRGRIVVLNFWATWCLPCREEMPIFRALHEAYAGRGVDIIAASADEAGSEDAIAEFVREEELTFPVWIGATVQDLHRLGLGDAIPATAILDRQGRIAFRLSGLVTRERIEERIDWLIAGGAGPPPARFVDAFEEADPHEHGDDHEEADHDPAAEGSGGHEDHHDHGEDEEDHGHGGVGMEGASLVPS